MEKQEYVTPKVLEHGDVKEITLANASVPNSIDSTFIGPDGKVYSSYS
jgi:hypothetical protein